MDQRNNGGTQPFPFWEAAVFLKIKNQGAAVAKSVAFTA